MFASRAALRQGLRRTALARPQQQARGMAGGKYLHISEVHTNAGEAFGVVCWLWIFHRARQDLPVVLGWRHPWELGDDHGHGHAEADDHGHGSVSHAAPKASPTEFLEQFNSKAMIQTEVDDDDDDDDEDED